MYEDNTPVWACQACKRRVHAGAVLHQPHCWRRHTHARMHVRTNPHTHTHTHKRTSTPTHAPTHAPTHEWTCVQTHALTHARRFAHARARTHGRYCSWRVRRCLGRHVGAGCVLRLRGMQRRSLCRRRSWWGCHTDAIELGMQARWADTQGTHTHAWQAGMQARTHTHARMPVGLAVGVRVGSNVGPAVYTLACARCYARVSE